MPQYFEWKRAGANNPYYLHYFEENADLNQLYSQIKQSSVDVLRQQLARQKKAEAVISNSNSLSLQEQSDIDDIITGKVFENLGNEKLTASTSSVPDLDRAIAYAESTEFFKMVDTMADGLDAIQIYLDTYFTQENVNGIWQDYAKSVVEAYARNNNLPATEAASAIVKDILARNKNTFFEVQASNINAKSTIAKMAALAYALPQVPEYASAVANNDSSSAIGKQIKSRFTGWTNYLIRQLHEASSAVTVLQGNKELFEKLAQMNAQLSSSTMSTSGFVSVSSNFKPSQSQEHYLSMIPKALQRLTSQKVTRRDTSISIGTGAAKGQVNINVKTTKRPVSVETKQRTFTLRHSQSLLTLLTRDLNMNVHDVAQLATAIGDNANLNSSWEQMIEYAGYAAFLEAFSMSTFQNYTASLFAINDTIWTVQDVINHVISTVDSGSKVYLQAAGRDNQAGLQRATYVAMNKWLGGNYANTQLAERRSDTLEQDVTKQLYATKVNINLTLAEFASLMRLAK